MKPFLAEDSAQARTLSDSSGVLIGSTVLTQDGALPVEFLTEGDRIITRDTGMAALCHMEVVDLLCPMVRVERSALERNSPEQAVILPADQKLLLRKAHKHVSAREKPALIPVKHLIDGRSFQYLGNQKTRLFQLVFDAPHIIYVDGLELACERTLSKLRLVA
jgi:hypothetical protein